jgi:hypothetical protein
MRLAIGGASSHHLEPQVVMACLSLGKFLCSRPLDLTEVSMYHHQPTRNAFLAGFLEDNIEHTLRIFPRR